jgi:hypothetical protein
MAESPATIATDRLTNANSRLLQAKCRPRMWMGTRSPIQDAHEAVVTLALTPARARLAT